MAKGTQPLPYLQRVLEDEFVQEELRNAVSGARAAYLQARKQRSQAVADKRFYRNLRQTATALQKATDALRPQKPEPTRRGRKLATVALAIGATAFITMRLQRHYTQRRCETDLATASPAAPSVSPAGAEPDTEPEPAATAPAA